MIMSDSFKAVWTPRMLSILRIMTAALFIESGTTKLFGWPGAPLAAHPIFPVLIAGVIETVGSLLLLAGFYTRAAAFIMAGEMAVAYFYSHFPRAFFPFNNGGSLAILYCFVFLYLIVAGAGPWSVDARCCKK
jgi:putative oxidoreductase